MSKTFMTSFSLASCSLSGSAIAVPPAAAMPRLRNHKEPGELIDHGLVHFIDHGLVIVQLRPCRSQRVVCTDHNDHLGLDDEAKALVDRAAEIWKESIKHHRISIS